MTRFKKCTYAVIIIAIMMLFFIGCRDVGFSSEEPTLNMYVDINNEGSSYVLMSSGSVKQRDNNCYDVYIDNPELITFKISEEKYPEGICVVDSREISTMIFSIEKILSTQDNQDNDTAIHMKEILQQLKEIPIMTGEKYGV